MVLEGIMTGLSTAFTLTNILMVSLGVFAGTFIGMLPGLGPISTIALMIPITYGFEPSSGLILMAGVYYGAVFGGSTSSILLNTPGRGFDRRHLLRWLSPRTGGEGGEGTRHRRIFIIFRRNNRRNVSAARSTGTRCRLAELPIC